MATGEVSHAARRSPPRPRPPGSRRRTRFSRAVLRPLKSSSSAPRAARPTISPAPWRVQSGATFGLTRFSLTELAARAAAERLAGVRRAPGTQAGAEAMAARAVFDADAPEELEYFAPVASLPGFPRALARTLHELRLAGVGADALDAPRADRGVRRPRPPARASRGGAVGRRRRRSRGAVPLAAAACRAGQVRWARLPLVLLDVPLDSRAEREFVGALASASPDVLATVPDGDVVAREALEALGAPVGDDAPTRRGAGFRSCAPPPVRVHDRASGRRASAPATSGCSRRPAKDARRSRSSGACSTKPTRRAVRRDGGLPARAAAVPRPARARVRARRRAGVLRSRHAAARSGRPRVRRAALVRRRRAVGEALRRVPLARPGAAGRRLAGRPPPRRAARRGVSFAGGLDDRTTPSDDPDVGRRPTPDRRFRRRSGRRRHAAVAVEVGRADRRVGRGRRPDARGRQGALAPAARRARGGLSSTASTSSRRDEPESPRIGRFERDLRNLRAPARVRAADHRRARRLARRGRRGASGSSGSRRWRAARCGARRACCRRSPTCGRWPTSVRSRSTKRATSCTIAWSTLDWEPPARRYGRVFVGTPHQARGRSFRVVFVPGLAERVVPQRPREDPLLLDERARGDRCRRSSRRTIAAAAERLLLKLAIGAASRAPVSVVSAPGRRRNARARAVVLRARRDARDHRARAGPPRARGGRGRRRRARASRGRRRRIPTARSTISSTTSRSLKPLLDARDPASVKGRAHYLLGLNEALRRSVISRWARGRTAWSPSDGLIRVAPGIARGARRAAARPAAVLAVGAAALRRLSVPVPARDDLSPRAVGRARAARAHGSADARQPVSQGAGRVLPRAGQARARCRSRATRVPDAVADARRGARSRRGGVRGEAGAGDRPRLARRDRRAAARPRHLGAEDWPTTPTGCPTYFEFSFGLNDEGRDPRSLPDPVIVDGRFLLRGSVDLIEQRARPRRAARHRSQDRQEPIERRI